MALQDQLRFLGRWADRESNKERIILLRAAHVDEVRDEVDLLWRHLKSHVSKRENLAISYTIGQQIKEGVESEWNVSFRKVKLDQLADRIVDQIRNKSREKSFGKLIVPGFVGSMPLLTAADAQALKSMVDVQILANTELRDKLGGFKSISTHRSQETLSTYWAGTFSVQRFLSSAMMLDLIGFNLNRSIVVIGAHNSC